MTFTTMTESGMARMFRLRAVMLLPLLIAGCGDPYQRAGTWHPLGLNDANLAQAVQDKQDLVRGHEQPGSDGMLNYNAVERLRMDKLRPLTLEDTSILSGGSH